MAESLYSPIIRSAMVQTCAEWEPRGVKARGVNAFFRCEDLDVVCWSCEMLKWIGVVSSPDSMMPGQGSLAGVTRVTVYFSHFKYM